MKDRVVVLLIALRENLRGKQDKNCKDWERSGERDHNPDLVRKLKLFYANKVTIDTRSPGRNTTLRQLFPSLGLSGSRGPASRRPLSRPKSVLEFAKIDAAALESDAFRL